jgi:threonylcarbamoyladenosine tRNA methylthiotransferase MtaB
MPEVDKVIGNQEKIQRSSYISEEKIVLRDIMLVRETTSHLVQTFEERARAFIQIQNGCDQRCTFCIIPYGRGNNRSVPIGELVKQLKIVALQYPEVVFTGVDITGYGSDLPGKPTLAQMTRRVLDLVPEIQRLRFSSIDVAEIDRDLFELMAKEPRIMPHFHISLQSGDNMILKRMKRRHNRVMVIDFCLEMRKARPETGFGADIIAGFPTENDEMFENTKNLIHEAKLQYLHVFPYSSKEGTPASRMPQVTSKIRKARAEILRRAGQKELFDFLNLNIGSKVNVLMETSNSGHSENFMNIELSSDAKK